MITIPPIQNSKGNTVKSKPTTSQLNIGTAITESIARQNQLDYSNIRPMGEILGTVSDRIAREQIYNQGLSAAEQVNSRGVIENKIAQYMKNGVDNSFSINERDLALAGEELRTQVEIELQVVLLNLTTTNNTNYTNSKTVGNKVVTVSVVSILVIVKYQ